MTAINDAREKLKLELKYMLDTQNHRGVLVDAGGDIAAAVAIMDRVLTDTDESNTLSAWDLQKLVEFPTYFNSSSDAKLQGIAAEYARIVEPLAKTFLKALEKREAWFQNKAALKNAIKEFCKVKDSQSIISKLRLIQDTWLLKNTSGYERTEYWRDRNQEDLHLFRKTLEEISSAAGDDNEFEAFIKEPGNLTILSDGDEILKKIVLALESKKDSMATEFKTISKQYLPIARLIEELEMLPAPASPAPKPVDKRTVEERLNATEAGKRLKESIDYFVKQISGAEQALKIDDPDVKRISTIIEIVQNQGPGHLSVLELKDLGDFPGKIVRKTGAKYYPLPSLKNQFEKAFEDSQIKKEMAHEQRLQLIAPLQKAWGEHAAEVRDFLYPKSPMQCILPPEKTKDLTDIYLAFNKLARDYCYHENLHDGCKVTFETSETRIQELLAKKDGMEVLKNASPVFVRVSNELHAIGTKEALRYFAQIDELRKAYSPAVTDIIYNLEDLQPTQQRGVSP